MLGLAFSGCILGASRAKTAPPSGEEYRLSLIEVEWHDQDTVDAIDSIRIRERLIHYHQWAVDQFMRRNAIITITGDSAMLESTLKTFAYVDSGNGKSDTIFKSQDFFLKGQVFQADIKKTVDFNQPSNCLNTQRESMTDICFEMMDDLIYSTSCVLLGSSSKKIEDALMSSAAYFHSKSCADIGETPYRMFEIRYFYGKKPG